MPAFEFQPGDAEALREACATLRKRAKNDPCVNQQQAVSPKYSFKFGPWHLSLTIDLYTEVKAWHGSVACLDQVGEVPVQFPGGMVAYVPQDAILSVHSWDDEHKKQADFLLGELMGSLITDAQQQVKVTDGLFARHWETPFKG
jgi:hypothetical protein